MNHRDEPANSLERMQIAREARARQKLEEELQTIVQQIVDKATMTCKSQDQETEKIEETKKIEETEETEETEEIEEIQLLKKYRVKNCKEVHFYDEVIDMMIPISDFIEGSYITDHRVCHTINFLINKAREYPNVKRKCLLCARKATRGLVTCGRCYLDKNEKVSALYLENIDK